MKITTILVDDEPKALAILENKISRLCPEIEIIGTVQNPRTAISMIKELKPQLIFLDVSMPEISGFGVLAEFESPDFEIIFATAYDQYAIDAIRNCAIGYLVKPIDNQDLVLAVKNAVENIKKKSALQKNLTLVDNNKVELDKKRIVIPSEDGFEFIKVLDIVRCEGITGYTRIHFTERKSIVSSYSIGFFNKLLKNANFYLTHKSHLINVFHLVKYLNEGFVELTNNQTVPVSRSKRTEFIRFLK